MLCWKFISKYAPLAAITSAAPPPVSFNFSRCCCFTINIIARANNFTLNTHFHQSIRLTALRQISTNHNINYSQLSPCPSNCASLTKIRMTSNGTHAVRPNGILFNWDFRQISVGELEKKCNESLEQIKLLGDKISTAQNINYEEVLQPYFQIRKLYGPYGEVGSIFHTGRKIADSEEIRNTLVKCENKIEEALVDLEMRKDVFDKIVQLRNSDVYSTLGHEQRMSLEKIVLYGKRNGLELGNDALSEIKILKNKINGLTSQFVKNISDENTSFLFTADELKGTGDQFIMDLDKDIESGKFKVTLKYPHYFPIMKKCVVPSTRQKMEFAFNSRCNDKNSKILEELANLRQSLAEVLGYPDHATYNQEVLMAKDPETVDNFLKDLIPKLKPFWEKEKEEMLELKKKECADLGYEFDGKINGWDFNRYLDGVHDRKFSLDQDLIKSYFPFETVKEGLLTIYQKLLGLKFTRIQNPEKWHEDVQMYKVAESSSGEILGYFYLDLFPREGKYGHACCEPVQWRFRNPDGTKTKASSILICNFPKPTPENPSLLDHDEVVTFFHEFGHCCHFLLSETETPILRLFGVEEDFLEAPSQMLENWCFEKEPLQIMSLHYKTKEKIPDELIESLIKSKLADAGGFTLRQISLATIDQRIHRAQRYKLVKMYADTVKEIMDLDITPGTNKLASFEHLCNDYDAKYYGYLWSKVFGDDMFETVFKKEGILSPVAGMKYRKNILEPGWSTEAKDMLKNFLGREPISEPFLRNLGLL